MRVGVLALQGDFRRHVASLSLLGATSLLIKKPSELTAIDALVLPGGESTTLLKLLDSEFKEVLHETIANGLPTFATCAGLILLARSVKAPEQESLNLLDIEVTRNAYGSQKNSFITDDLAWQIDEELDSQEGVFIRAPKISATGPKTQILITHNQNPVCIQEANIIGATFHPELSGSDSPLIGYFLRKAASK